MELAVAGDSEKPAVGKAPASAIGAEERSESVGWVEGKQRGAHSAREEAVIQFKARSRPCTSGLIVQSLTTSSPSSLSPVCESLASYHGRSWSRLVLD